MSKKHIIIGSIVVIATSYFIGRHLAKKKGYSTSNFGATIFGVPKIDKTNE